MVSKSITWCVRGVEVCPELLMNSQVIGDVRSQRELSIQLHYFFLAPSLF